VKYYYIPSQYKKGAPYTQKRRNPTIKTSEGKGKAIPLEAWTGPEVSRG
jgi:hypothetical protein